MDIEIKKSYNPFKMWGSWIGLGIGLASTVIYTWVGNLRFGPAYNPFEVFFSFLNKIATVFIMGNPFVWVPNMTVSWIAVVYTPLLFFIYGWAIHSIFRKLAK